MNKQEFDQLAAKITDGTATRNEVAQFNAWFNTYADGQTWDTDELGEPRAVKNQLFSDIQAEINRREPAKVRPFYYRIAAAASILFVVSAGAYFILRKPIAKPESTTQAYHNDIAPGHNQATLTLANGQKIILTNGINGTVAQQGKTAIIVKDQNIVYTTGQQAEVKTMYNTLTTARGEKSPYPLVLADGTKVWLNAESSLSFPVAFNSKERIVKLTGEAYFEVKHNVSQPFKVQTEKQTIEDIGTSFNVNAYADESTTNTTLIEGSVKINNLILKPGEQTDGNKVSEVNTAQFLAWKNNDFDFEGDRIETVMRQLTRWYNIEVTYEGTITKEVFYATLTRQRPISSVLKALEKTKGVHFKIEGRRVVVSK
jgi:transmembrane sensor